MTHQISTRPTARRSSWPIKAVVISATFFSAGLYLQAAANSDTSPVISQKNRTYAPGSVTVRAGETVRIINDDIFLHHAFVDSETLQYDSGSMEEGETRDIAFPVAGEYTIKCAIHPKMRLKVTVE